MLRLGTSERSMPAVERLAKVAVELWARPDDTDALLPDASVGSRADAEPTVTLAGPPDPQNPSGFLSPLGIADQVGVGRELRRIIDVCRELGLYPRPDRYSVMVAPPADRRVMLFTVWPRQDEDGSFRIWKSPKAFARYVPGVTLEHAQAVLGTSEEEGVLPAYDTEALLAAIRILIPEPLAAVDGAPEPDEPGILRADVRRIITRRSGQATQELALEFSRLVLELDGVRLRPQKSKGEPSYFQVRYRAFGTVIAYVTPRTSEVGIEYRLPATHETYGVAISRDQAYGIQLRVRSAEDLPVAIRLLQEAIALTG